MTSLIKSSNVMPYFKRFVLESLESIRFWTQSSPSYCNGRVHRSIRQTNASSRGSGHLRLPVQLQCRRSDPTAVNRRGRVSSKRLLVPFRRKSSKRERYICTVYLLWWDCYNPVDIFISFPVYSEMWIS